MKLLLTRQIDWNTSDRKLFEQLGYEIAEEVPLIEIWYLPWAKEDKQHLRDTEWLFFTSHTPITNTLAFVETSKKIAVIGERSAKEVRNNGFEPTFISSSPNKKTMLKEWQAQYPNADQIFYPKSDLADQWVEDTLAAKDIYSFVSYRNVCPEVSTKKLAKLLEKAAFDAVYLTSPSAWQRFLQVYQEYDHPLELIAIGTTTLNEIEKNGYKGRLLAELRPSATH